MRRGIFTLAVLLLAIVHAAPAAALDKASFRLSWLISATAAPFYLGVD